MKVRHVVWMSRNPLEAGLSFRRYILKNNLYKEVACRNPLEAGLSFRPHIGSEMGGWRVSVAIPSKRGCLSDRMARLYEIMGGKCRNPLEAGLSFRRIHDVFFVH